MLLNVKNAEIHHRPLVGEFDGCQILLTGARPRIFKSRLARTLFMVGLTLLLSNIFVYPLRAEIGNCQALDRMKNTNDEESSKELLSNFFKSSLGKNESSNNDSYQNESLYFTDHSGFSVRPKCNAKSKYQAHIYYPIGLVVKKLSDKEFEPKKNEKYTLVEAEHGFRMYISSNHLQPINEDMTYIFADSVPEFPPYCLGSSNCTEKKKREAILNGHVLHPRSRYAVASGNLLTCQNIEIELYDEGNERLLQKDGRPQAAILNVCNKFDSSDNISELNWPKNLKIVTLSEYKKLFSYQVGGHYQRLSDSILESIIPNATNKKLCNEISFSQIEDRLATGGEAKLDIYVASFSGDAEMSKIRRRIKELGDGKYIFYSYYIQREKSENSSSSERLFPVETIFKCDEDNLIPESLLLVTFHSDQIEGGELTLVAKQLFSQLSDTRPKLTQLKSNGKDTAREFSGFIKATASGLKIGQFWRIKGYYEYLRLRNALRKFLREETKVTEIVEHDAENHVFERNLNYYTHLFLIALTEPKPERPK